MLFLWAGCGGNSGYRRGRVGAERAYVAQREGVCVCDIKNACVAALCLAQLAKARGA